MDTTDRSALTVMLRTIPRSRWAGTVALATLQVVAACVVAVALARALTPVVLRGELDRATLAIAVVALVARAVAGYALRAAAEGYAASAVTQSRRRLTDAVVSMGVITLSRHRAADLAALDTELSRLHPVYARYVPSVASCAAASVIIPVVLLWLDPATGLLVILTLPLTVLFLALVGSATTAAVDRQWRSHVALGSRLVDITRNIATIDSYGATGAYRRVFQDASAQHAKVTGKVLRSAFLSGFVLEVAAILSTALAAVWIGARLVGGNAELAPTMAALILLGEVFLPLRTMGAERHAAMDAVPVQESLARITGLPPVRGGSRPVASVTRLDLIGCSARLDDATPRPVTGVAERGRPVALVGPSGSGKSTLLLAIAGHADHTGSLLVDGIDRSELDLTQWRAGVAYVPQRPRVVPASIAENVRLAAPEASLDDVTRALQLVSLAPVVAALPRGLETMIGDGGVHLSGGEVARLALARVLVDDAQVVLLDEVTAHLDDATAADIVTVIEQQLADRVVMFATHLGVPAGWGRWEVGA